MKPTIYKYVTEHLDEQGRYTEFGLCDDSYAVIPQPLGTEDAFCYTTNTPPDAKAASLIVKALRDYLDAPGSRLRQKLYDTLLGKVFGEYCDAFLDSFNHDDMTPMAYDLARSFFYNAQNREQVKFAYLLFGLQGMEQIKEKDGELWQDLLQVARCEEFTFVFLYSCRVSKFRAHDEIWELLGCTNGWGKVFAVSDCECRTEEERRWLLEYGPDITVEYPPLSVKLITATNLDAYLNQDLDYDLYKSVMAIMGNYLIMLTRFSAEHIEETFNTSNINLYSMLQRLLQQAKRIITKPEDLLDIMTVFITLRSLGEAQNMAQMTPNQCQLLEAACDDLLYGKNWLPEVKARLIENGKVNYVLCDFAYEMELDVWDTLMNYWLQHPEETALLPYLLVFEGDGRSERVIQNVCANISLYSFDQQSLIVPLRYLQNHPGAGEAIICAALKSMYDFPRGLACDTLETWGQAYITPLIRNALLEARQLCINKVLAAHIDNLLQGKAFSPLDFLQENL